MGYHVVVYPGLLPKTPTLQWENVLRVFHSMPDRWLLEAGMPNANLEAWGALPIVLNNKAASAAGRANLEWGRWLRNRVRGGSSRDTLRVGWTRLCARVD